MASGLKAAGLRQFSNAPINVGGGGGGGGEAGHRVGI